MELKQALNALEQSRKFKDWQKKNISAYFSYAFKIIQEMPNEWQLGFYDSKKDKITTFVIDKANIKIRPEEEIFKKENVKVNEVQLEKVNLAFDSVLEKANEFQQQNFPKDKSIKTISILQNIEELGNVWNITCITESFNTLNIKMDASSGKVIEHNLSSIFSFKE